MVEFRRLPRGSRGRRAVVGRPTGTVATKRSPEGSPATAARKARNERLVGTLTVRLKEVLALLALGQSNTEIAAALKLSVRTIEGHRYDLMKRAGAHNVQGLMRLALEQGWIEAPPVKVNP